VNGIDPTGMFTLPEINVTALIQSILFTLNLFGAVYHARQMAISTVQVYNQWVMGDFWGGLPYIVLAILHGAFCVLNIIGMVTAMKPPPSGAVMPALAGVGAAGSQQFWATVISNPAWAGWVVKTVGPAAMSAYCFMSKNTEVGQESSFDREGPVEDHHKVPHGNKGYKFHKHPLFRKAGWTKEMLEKDPRNRMLLGSHRGRHWGSYLEEVWGMANHKYETLGTGGKAAANRAVLELLDELEKDIIEGRLKPYERNVWPP
jgi:hypothetical protein